MTRSRMQSTLKSSLKSISAFVDVDPEWHFTAICFLSYEQLTQRSALYHSAM